MKQTSSMMSKNNVKNVKVIEESAKIIIFFILGVKLLIFNEFIFKTFCKRNIKCKL